MIKELENKLMAKNIKPTVMRLLVLEVLLKREAAISLNNLEGAFEKADRITLYRTLKTFEEKGLIHSVEDGTGSTKYALCEEGCSCAPEDMHVHFHCRQCVETYCLPKSRVPEVPLPESFLSEEVNLAVKGVCGSCAAKNAMRLQAGR